jgi:hypothetical protein
VSRYGGLRIEVIDSTLNVETLDGVGVIRCPDLRRVAKHTEIKTVATRGAALKENFGVLFVEYSTKNLVDAEGVSMEEFALLLKTR